MARADCCKRLVFLSQSSVQEGARVPEREPGKAEEEKLRRLEGLAQGLGCRGWTFTWRRRPVMVPVLPPTRRCDFRQVPYPLRAVSPLENWA